MVGCEHAAALVDSLAAAESRSLICYDDSDVRRSAPTRATWGFNAEVRADLAAPTWQGIVNVADEIDAAVIVLGSRGLGAARELLEGSVSHEVAQHAGRPVLIVPPAGRR